jgi:hypothetical protein
MRLDDDHWEGLRGGYRVPYDPRPALKRIAQGEVETAWDELWQNLHHQGDVDVASYAAVPEIVRLLTSAPIGTWRAYGLLATIEECRLGTYRPNPPVPDWLEEDYRAAWNAALEPALRHFARADDDLTATSILAVLAHAKGLTSIGVIASLEQSERQEMLNDLLGWPSDENEAGHAPLHDA